MTAPLRQQARDLYRRHGGDIGCVARRLGLRSAKVRALIFRGIEPGKVEGPKPPTPRTGCGCTERKLCAEHGALLDRLRATS